MMDSRYFHGIRTAAAHALVRHATTQNDADMVGLFHLRKAFEELYCNSEGGSVITRPNNFSDQLSYLLQCAIIEAISRVRDDQGYTPQDVKEFLLDKLKFNDNSQNDYSDAYYVSTLIKALSHALVDRPPVPPEDDLKENRNLELHWANVMAFEKSCLDEIDRYRRMDEWTSSYQNLYSRTVIQCQARLARATIGNASSLHYLQYTRPGNFDMLRCTAYDIIAATGLFANDIVLRYFIHCMVADTSPWIRDRLRQAFGKALARKAIGLDKPLQNNVAQTMDLGLSVDNPAADGVQEESARRTSVEAALAALKRELGDNQSLQQFLWQALNYPDSGFEDVRAMLDFCQMLFPERDEARVSLRLPRYWKVEAVGKGKLKFARSNRVRTKAAEKWKPKIPLKLNTLPPTAPSRQSTGKIKLKFGKRESITVSSRQNSFSVPSPTPVAATPTPPPQTASQQTSQPARPMLKLKLKAPGGTAK